MPTVESHVPGSFCFVELASLDQNQAKTFYEPLLGWSHTDFPMGPDSFYTMFQLAGRDAAAAYTMRDEERAQASPHWNLYVAVESADDAATLAADLGGTVIAAPFDVPGQGRMAVIQDPTGAFFCIWQASNSIGIRVAGENGTLCWADLNTPDPEGAKTFYEGLFGWNLVYGENDPSGYLHIKNGEEFIGGIPPAEQRDPSIPPNWMIYYQVDDVDATAAKAKQLGGSEYLAPMTMEGVGRMAVVADPQGASFAIFKSST
jgi:predicted enzyme related to lactoylglutathione lyase